MKAPKPGDRITQYLSHIKETRTGTVLYLLNGQFAYRTDEDQHCLCSLSEDWAYADKPSKYTGGPVSDGGMDPRT